MASPPPPPIIAVLGSLNVDLVTRTPRVPAAGETIIANGLSTGHGGKGANQAVACARLSRRRRRRSSSPPPPADVEVRMVGAVGDDQFGRDFRVALAADGLDVEGVRVVAGERTGTAVIVVEEASGENRIMVNAGANWRVEARPLVPEGTGVVVLQLEVPMEVVEVNVRDAKSRGIDVSILSLSLSMMMMRGGWVGETCGLMDGVGEC